MALFSTTAHRFPTNVPKRSVNYAKCKSRKVAMRMYVSLLFVLTFVSSALAQLMPKSSSAKRASAQQLSSISETYSDTLGMLKTWLDTEKNADLGRLFVAGDSRASDLVTACQNADDEIAAAAFMTLQLL